MKAVLSLAVPTVISQMITVFYNMTDTFFIGQLNDPKQVAAATVAMPLFMILTAVANLFGIGGSSLISRCLGAGDREKAKQTSAFCIWSAAVTALIYGMLLFLFRPVILPMLGARQDTYNYTYSYVLWTVTIGGIPSVLNYSLAHLVRAEGCSKEASLGVAGSGILNMLLDPLFIFVFKMNIVGAAMATMLSNAAAVVYFFLLLRSRKDTTVLTADPLYFTLRQHIPMEVLAVGLPSFLISLMATVSNSALNSMIASASTEAVAGMGIAKKINMMAFAVAQGITQGSLPLIGFNYSAGNRKRMRSAVKTVLFLGIGVAAVLTSCLYGFASAVTSGFIDDAETISYAQQFLRIICFACPSTTISFLLITVFQAVGKKLQPAILSCLRKGLLDIPLMYAFRPHWGLKGVAWATPVADISAVLISAFIFLPFWKKLTAAQIEK